MGLLSECLSIFRTQWIMFIIGLLLAQMTWVIDKCETLDEVVNLDHRALRPEGTENIPLGSQVSDLCF